MATLRLGRGHPAHATLSLYLDNALPGPERDALERHVRDCIPCRRLLGSLSQTIRALGSLREPTPTGRAEAVIAALSSTIGKDGSPRLAVVRGPGIADASERAGWRPILGAVLRYCLRRSQLRVTVPTGVLLGIVLSLVNMGGKLLPGEFDLRTCAVCAADFLLPFVAINVVLLVATWRTRGR